MNLSSDMSSLDELVLEAGSVFAKKYELVRPAGFGGMAELWVATNRSTGAEVCVKILIAGHSQTGGEAIARFRQEARAAANLNHRSIVRVFDFLEVDGRGDLVTAKTQPYAYVMVMELLHGETLGDALAKRHHFELEEALDLFLPVVSALAHAHRASVVHRDIKPDNIFLAKDPDGHVTPKVLDFGVSKVPGAEQITAAGILVGTPSFMSPEQAKGARDVDARSDVFSAATLFYTMLTGENPFELGSTTFASVIDAVLRRTVAAVEGLPPEVWAVIERSLYKDPNLRYADATEMGMALRKACGRRVTTDPNVEGPLSTSGVRAASLSTPGEPMPLSVTVDDDPAQEAVAADLGAAKRRRLIVIAVVGAAAVLGIAALVASRSQVSPATTSTLAGEQPPREAPAPSLLPAALAPPVRPAPSASSTTSVERAASSSSSSTPAAPRREPSRSAPTPATERKPGEEPNKARDPGF